MQTRKQMWNWITDAILMVGFLVAFFLDLTGLALHQWLGAALGLLAGYHFLSHWDWVKSVAGRFLGQTSRQARRYFLLDGHSGHPRELSQVGDTLRLCGGDLPFACAAGHDDFPAGDGRRLACRDSMAPAGFRCLLLQVAIG